MIEIYIYIHIFDYIFCYWHKVSFDGANAMICTMDGWFSQRNLFRSRHRSLRLPCSDRIIYIYIHWLYIYIHIMTGSIGLPGKIFLHAKNSDLERFHQKNDANHTFTAKDSLNIELDDGKFYWFKPHIWWSKPWFPVKIFPWKPIQWSNDLNNNKMLNQVHQHLLNTNKTLKNRYIEDSQAILHPSWLRPPAAACRVRRAKLWSRRIRITSLRCVPWPLGKEIKEFEATNWWNVVPSFVSCGLNFHKCWMDKTGWNFDIHWYFRFAHLCGTSQRPNRDTTQQKHYNFISPWLRHSQQFVTGF